MTTVHIQPIELCEYQFEDNSNYFIYQCLQCGRHCCWCFGSDDMYLDYCDDCVLKGIPTNYEG